MAQSLAKILVHEFRGFLAAYEIKYDEPYIWG
jgi:hypothetical protein